MYGRTGCISDSWLFSFSPYLIGDFDPCLIGDAAGHTDPILGEGILYALWGATLAAEAVLEGHPEWYDRLWRDAYLPRFERHLRRARWLESGVLLDGLIGLARIPFVGARLYKHIGGQPHQTR